MRAKIALLLVHLAARVLTGRDDRVVLLNTKRHRARPGTPDAGRVHAFITSYDDPNRVPTFAPGTFPKDVGTPVPQRLARLAGYELEPVG